MEEKVKNLLVGAAAAVSAWLGALVVPAGLLVLCNVLDYVTGLMAAPRRGQARNSGRGYQGISKKISMWLLVVVGAVLDILLDYAAKTLGWQLPFRFAVACVVCVWLLANEILSILENISDLGVAVPPFLRPLVNWVKSKSEEEADVEK